MEKFKFAEEIFSGNSELRRVPPLPEVIREVNVSMCKLGGAWRGYFKYIHELNCAGSGLTEMPDVIRIGKGTKCLRNNLRYLSEGLYNKSDDVRDELPGVADPPVHERVANLLELGGAAVLGHGLDKRVEVDELREYLVGFRSCPSCGVMAVLRRYFTDAGKCSRLRCYRCVNKFPRAAWTSWESLGPGVAPRHGSAYLRRYSRFVAHREKNKIPAKDEIIFNEGLPE
jgi:hypothetical protein